MLKDTSSSPLVSSVISRRLEYLLHLFELKRSVSSVVSHLLHSFPSGEDASLLTLILVVVFHMIEGTLDKDVAFHLFQVLHLSHSFRVCFSIFSTRFEYS